MIDPRVHDRAVTLLRRLLAEQLPAVLDPEFTTNVENLQSGIELLLAWATESKAGLAEARQQIDVAERKLNSILAEAPLMLSYGERLTGRPAVGEGSEADGTAGVSMTRRWRPSGDSSTGSDGLPVGRERSPSGWSWSGRK